MSTRIVINVTHQSEDLQFDIAGVNEALMEDSELAELYERVVQYKWFDGVFKLNGNRIMIADPEDDRYTSHVDAYYCWTTEVMQVIADHISQGKLVLSENSEDLAEDTLYYILTPGNVETYKPRFE